MASDPNTWTQTWRAKIMEDHLYLSAVNTITEREACVKDRRTLATAFGWIDGQANRPMPNRVGLCSHVKVFDLSCLNLIHLRDEGYHSDESYSAGISPGRRVWLGIDSGSGSGGSQFTPRYKIPGACIICLMDFTTSITWLPSTPLAPNVEESGRWQVIFTSYHLLGQCRTPKDWMWADMSRIQLSRRRPSWCRPGSIQRRWETNTKLERAEQRVKESYQRRMSLISR